MSFQKIPTKTARGRPIPDGCVSLMVYQANNRGGLAFSVSLPPKCLELGGLEHATTVDLLFGSGPDDGKAAIAPGDSLKIYRKQGARSCFIRTSRCVVATQKMAPRRVPYQVIDGMIVFDIPDGWIKAPTSFPQVAE